jgi:type IV pilus assembly protein PilX
MNIRIMHSPTLERGMALVSALLLLLVLTMLSVGMFRSFGLQEHLAGNTREKARATHAAEASQTDAENWLVTNANTIAGGGSSSGTNCSGVMTTPQVCSNLLTNVTQPDTWTSYVQYQPSSFQIMGTGTTAAYNFASAPMYYVSFLAQNYVANAGSQLVSYQIDAASYGGSTNTISVVESTYLVAITYNARNDNKKYIPGGGP